MPWYEIEVTKGQVLVARIKVEADSPDTALMKSAGIQTLDWDTLTLNRIEPEQVTLADLRRPMGD